VPSIAAIVALLELYDHSYAPEIDRASFAKTELAVKVAAAAKAVVPKSNLRIAYPLFKMFSEKKTGYYVSTIETFVL
jgi:hypothetical protein